MDVNKCPLSGSPAPTWPTYEQAALIELNLTLYENHGLFLRYNTSNQERSLWVGIRDETLPSSKALPFHTARMVVKCTSAGQFTGQGTFMNYCY